MAGVGIAASLQTDVAIWGAVSKCQAPLGRTGLSTWWRQVIESCYHQGSESGVGVCRGFIPDLGVFWAE